MAGTSESVRLAGGQGPGWPSPAPSRPSRESLRVKTPSRAESQVALNKTESLIFDICYCLAGSGDLTRVLHFVVEPAWARLGE